MVAELCVRIRMASWVRRSDCCTVVNTRTAMALLYQIAYLIDTTSQSLATAALQIRLPRNPLPPHTTSFFFAATVVAEVDMSAETQY